MICLPHMIYAMNVQRLRFPLLVTSYLFVFCLFSSCREVETTPADTPQSTPERLRWWTDARFGMFIHYGPVTLTGDELSWSRANSNPQCPNKGLIPVEVYDSLYKKFNPADFKAGDWTSVAKTAGMKYIVLTTNHCDGFLLWDSKVDGYNIMATPFNRDLTGELAVTARKDSLRRFRWPPVPGMSISYLS